MDPKEWEALQAKMRGDFVFERDPEKRQILEKLKAKGISFGGQSDMDVEQLKSLEKAMDELDTGGGGFKMPGQFRTPGDGIRSASRHQKEEL